MTHNTIESKKFYTILPQGNIPLNKYMKKFKAKKNKIPFSYNSGENSHFLKQNELKRIIHEEIQTISIWIVQLILKLIQKKMIYRI